MSFRKLAGGGAACAYCGFVLVMEGERQCCPAGRDYDALQRERDEAVALLLETCERMSEAETTSRVLTGQLPEYSEGQQMLRSLAAKMGDSVKRIRAFRAADSASGEGEK